MVKHVCSRLHYQKVFKLQIFSYKIHTAGSTEKRHTHKQTREAEIEEAAHLRSCVGMGARRFNPPPPRPQTLNPQSLTLNPPP